MFRIPLIPLIALVLLALAGNTGCVHQPGAFRLTAQGNAATLIPPGVKDPGVARAAIRIGPIPRKTICSPSPHGLLIERKGLGGPRVVVSREAMNATTAAELFSWTVALEKEGCIRVNGALRLGEAVIDAVPLDLAKRGQLIQWRGDLTSVHALRVVAPIYKAGASTDAGEIAAVRQSEGSFNLSVNVIDSHSATGYEIDWYDLAAQGNGPGYRIVPRSAEVHIEDAIEHPAAPSTDRFQFGAEARWYQLLMMTKVSENDFDFVVVSARTSGELQDEVTAFQRDSVAFLRAADPESYTVMPHGSGINAYVRVKVNGVSVDLMRGSTVRHAILQTVPDPRTVLPQLKVRKLHDGKLYPVEWDRAINQVLSLALEGGEEIEW